jgi:hypothetical protein
MTALGAFRPLAPQASRPLTEVDWVAAWVAASLGVAHCRRRPPRPAQTREQGNRGRFPGDRRVVYVGFWRMRLARSGILGPGTPRRSPMKA